MRATIIPFRSVLIVIIGVFSLAACGGGGASVAGSGDSGSTATATGMSVGNSVSVVDAK